MSSYAELYTGLRKTSELKSLGSFWTFFGDTALQAGVEISLFCVSIKRRQLRTDIIWRELTEFCSVRQRFTLSVVLRSIKITLESYKNSQILVRSLVKTLETKTSHIDKNKPCEELHYWAGLW